MGIKRLETTTVCMPFEYDLAKDINDLITISNNTNKFRVECDAGKVVGLYKSAVQLHSILLDIVITNSTIEDYQLEEAKQALDNFFRNSSTPRGEG